MVKETPRKRTRASGHDVTAVSQLRRYNQTGVIQTNMKKRLEGLASRGDLSTADRARWEEYHKKEQQKARKKREKERKEAAKREQKAREREKERVKKAEKRAQAAQRQKAADARMRARGHGRPTTKAAR